MDARIKKTSSSIASRPFCEGSVANSKVQPKTRHDKTEIASLYDAGKLKPTTNKAGTIADKRVEVRKEEKLLFKSLLSKDPSLATSSIEQALGIWNKIQAIRVPSRRLSVSDNDLVQKLVQVTTNDPSITEVIMTNQDPRVLYIQPALLLEAAQALCGNTHVQKVVLIGMKLGNEFASALATSLQVNCILEHVDISNNGFTNVKEFLKTALRPERTSPLMHINVSNQHSPVRKYEKIVSLVKKHQNIRFLKADFDSCNAQSEIDSILSKRSKMSKVDYGALVVGALEAELLRRNALASYSALGPIEIPKLTLEEKEIPYFLDLEERSKRFQLRQEEEEKTSTAQTPLHLAPKAFNTSLAQISASLFTADGAFLTNEFITKYLVEASDRSLTFEFNNQCNLFRRFTKSDPARTKIVQRFVDTLMNHPKASAITHLHMANTLLGDDWLSYFCKRCIKDPSLLLNLHSLNIESNNIGEKGLEFLAIGLEKPAWKFLQTIKLDNQKKPFSTEAETMLLNALVKNRTVIKLSLRVRNACQRDQINLIVTRNIDLLRQARHSTKPSNAKRSRNKVEAMFDSIAADDKRITTVSLVADKIFQSLHPQEKLNAAKSFASNTQVTKIELNGLQLDDAFAVELAQSLKVNKKIESVDLENNSFGSDGILALVESLKTNRSIQTLKIRHQKKPLSSTDEEKVGSCIEGNEVVISLGLEPMRNPLAKMAVERKIRSNQDLKRSTKFRPK